MRLILPPELLLVPGRDGAHHDVRHGGGADDWLAVQASRLQSDLLDARERRRDHDDPFANDPFADDPLADDSSAGDAPPELIGRYEEDPFDDDPMFLVLFLLYC